MRQDLEAIVFDFDGVFRHFNPSRTQTLEEHYQLAPGSIVKAMFEDQEYGDVARGLLSKEQWIERTASIIGLEEPARLAIMDTGEIDPAMVELLGEIKKFTTPVALLTNSTDTIFAELDMFGLSASFDRVFATHKIGIAKPDAEIFELVCKELDCKPSSTFFTDDLPDNIDGAKAVGLQAHLFTSAETTRKLLEL